ncbi:MAG: hypothetical protein R3B70_26385 [Polyangiaceae bacterium]
MGNAQPRGAAAIEWDTPEEPAALKERGAAVIAGESATLDFVYSGDEPEPDVNKGELLDLF